MTPEEEGEPCVTARVESVVRPCVTVSSESEPCVTARVESVVRPCVKVSSESDMHLQIYYKFVFHALLNP